jgi:hypothetical protein
MLALKPRNYSKGTPQLHFDTTSGVLRTSM